MSYPPPTLIKRRSRGAWARYAVLLITVALVLGTCTASQFLTSAKAPVPVDDPEQAAPPPSTAETPIAVEPPIAAAADPAPVVAEPKPRDEPARPQPAADTRQPDRWYYVSALGDGPGAIYSGSDRRWDYAFACNVRSRTIEFIAAGTGDPGAFEGQMMRIGGTKLDLDARYAKDHGGTISARLPAKHGFLDMLIKVPSFDVQLIANREATLPVSADVVRVIRDCRGG